jgi:hypothetical protein
MAYYAIYGVFVQCVSREYLYPGCILGKSMGVSGCIQCVSWKGASRLDIGRQPSARDRSLVAEYTGYTLDTLDAPKIHLRYTSGYTLDTPHIHLTYTPDTPGYTWTREPTAWPKTTSPLQNLKLGPGLGCIRGRSEVYLECVHLF